MLNKSEQTITINTDINTSNNTNGLLLEMTPKYVNSGFIEDYKYHIMIFPSIYNVLTISEVL